MAVSAPPRTDVPTRTSGIEYLPGLDGLRALAVLAVIVYHADSAWLPGGFIGVEVFFVISGYLITRLLVAEHERAGRIDLVGFWGRRARRLFPALIVTLVGVLVATALLRPDTAGRVRGDFAAAAGYVTNWYQIFIGDGYATSGDFVPLRHLWSLAIEEQFYLLWPIVVLVLLRRGWSKLAIAVGSVAVALLSVGLTAALVPAGPIGDCAANPDAFWTVGERCISIADTLYLSTFSRASGLLLGAAFALVATHARGRRWTMFGDAAGGAGTAALVAMSMTMYFSATGVHPFLFRGGFLLVDVATLLLIAAVARPDTITAQALSARTMLWIGTRSYGLYLYHWPIFQLIRRAAGNPLTVWQFAGAMVVTGILAELSYRAIEMPIRRHGWHEFGRRAVGAARRTARWSFAVATAVALVVGLSALRMGTAEHQPSAIAAGLAAGADDVVSVEELLAGQLEQSRTAPPPTTAPPTTTSSPPATAPDSPSAAPDPPRLPVAPTVPSTEPATTLPPATLPPTTLPPVTLPPVTLPPATTVPAPVAPPATTPPDSTAPDADPSMVQTAPTEGAAPPPAAVRVPMLAIGDSVMLGAAPQLSEQGWVVNAEVSRQMIDTVPVLEQLRDAGVFGDVVLLHLGTNGSISDATLDAALATLVDVPLVVLVTIRADRTWAAGVSDRIRQRAGGNVVVLDWAVESSTCPGDCFEDDGIHLRPDGRRFYADLVAWAVAGADVS